MNISFKIVCSIFFFVYIVIFSVGLTSRTGYQCCSHYGPRKKFASQIQVHNWWQQAMTNDQFQCLTILTANYPHDTPTTTPHHGTKTIWLKIFRVVFSVEEITCWSSLWSDDHWHQSLLIWANSALNVWISAERIWCQWLVMWLSGWLLIRWCIMNRQQRLKARVDDSTPMSLKSTLATTPWYKIPSYLVGWPLASKPANWGHF